MTREELIQLVMENLCIPEHFSSYQDAATLLTAIREEESDTPFHLLSPDGEDGDPLWEVWEPFEGYTVDELYDTMDGQATAIVNFLEEHNLWKEKQ